MANDDIVKQFMALGLSEQKAKETLKNNNVTKNLMSALSKLENVHNLDSGVGMLIYHIATKIKPQILDHLYFLVKLTVENKLDTPIRIDAAIDYLLTNNATHGSPINRQELEHACGVGIIITPEKIDKAVEKQITLNKSEILKKRYRFNVGKILQDVRADPEMKWADGKKVKMELDVQLFDLLGHKTEFDEAPLSKTNKKNKSAEPKISGAISSDEGAGSIAELMRSKVHFHAPGENYKTDGYIVTKNTEKLLIEHLKATNGKVQTRFPPEPNGILHIGHAKAININFGYAAAHDGICFLRYDDTNPEKEEEKFFVGIKEMVGWLGYTPYEITHSSDYFEQLYQWAVKLISNDMAYVCHQPADEMKGFNPKPSQWRQRPVAESLQLFQDMKNGKINEGAATLRMKITLEEGKIDPVAYRIKFIAHHRTGTDWCIYPTYDYTHCLCDSIENITHSLCTKEFQSRRSSYYWLCNALDIYCPVQWEYGRLNVNYTVVSKRKIAKLITEKIVNDWDDPRLYTLSALRRRGYPAEAINNFCAQIGITGSQSTVDPSMLEACVRDILNMTAPRVLVVLEPLKVTLLDIPTNFPKKLHVPNFPNAPERGTHEVNMNGKVIYIDKNDFKQDPEKGYRRLSLSQTVGLRHAGLVIRVVKMVKNSLGEVDELLCRCESSEIACKPQAYIQWVSDPISIEVRLYERLFYHKNPEDINEVPGGFLSDCNHRSLRIVDAYADTSLLNAKPFENYQFERIGFFNVDPDSNNGRLVFNRTVELK